MFNTIGFIGTGTMGSAVARAAVKGAPEASILLSNRTPAKAEALAKDLGVQASDNETVARTCSLIFLGVKPQMMAGMLEAIAPVLAARSDRFVLASMAAGLDARRIQAMAGGKYPVICFMPNTPVAVGAGVVQYYGLDAAEEELDGFQALLAPAGLVDRIEPAQLNAASAVSGCGPAFCSLFIEALADGGVACGLPRAKALAYAAQMVEGTAKADAGAARPPGRAERRGLLPRRHHHPGGARAGGKWLPLRRHGGGHRRLRQDRRHGQLRHIPAYTA